MKQTIYLRVSDTIINLWTKPKKYNFCNISVDQHFLEQTYMNHIRKILSNWANKHCSSKASFKKKKQVQFHLHTAYPNLRGEMKVMLTGKFIAVSAYLKIW